MNSNRLKAFGIELPEDVEKEVLEFMKYGIADKKLFTATVLREGTVDLMQRMHPEIQYPENWPRRIIDALLKREKEAGRIEIPLYKKGSNVFWAMVQK